MYRVQATGLVAGTAKAMNSSSRGKVGVRWSEGVGSELRQRTRRGAEDVKAEYVFPSANDTRLLCYVLSLRATI